MNRHADAGKDESNCQPNHSLLSQMGQLVDRERVLRCENDQLRAQLVDMKQQEKKKYDALMVQYCHLTNGNQVTVKSEWNDEDVKEEMCVGAELVQSSNDIHIKREHFDEQSDNGQPQQMDKHDADTNAHNVTVNIKTESCDCDFVVVKQEIKEEHEDDGARVMNEFKREIKEENEMTLQNVMDNAPEGNEQIGDCVKREMKEEEEDGQIMQIEEEEEVGDGQTRASDFEELTANEGDNEESSSVEDAQNGTTRPHLTRQTQGIVKQSAKRKQTDQVKNQEDTKEEDEDGQVDESSRHVKRPRLDTTQPNNAIATDTTTNPIQPNRHLQCQNCHKSFDCISKLQRHLRVHTGERPFHCHLCEKRFKERNKLTRHQLIHRNIKNFQCNQCEKQFTRKDELDSHLRIHSGERPFTCRHCEKSFKELDALNKHEQAIHLHVKSYRCKQCGHTATQQSNIITHARVVHFGLPRTVKEQRALNIIDDRDPRELVEKV